MINFIAQNSQYFSDTINFIVQTKILHKNIERLGPVFHLTFELYMNTCMEPSTPKAAVVKVQAQRSPLKQQHQEQHHPVEDRRHVLLRKSDSGSEDLRRKFEEMKRMTKEHLRKEEDAYRKELEMKVI